MKLFFLLTLLCLVSAPARAASYYVDCVHGIDGANNPGTSPASPWKSVGRVNGFIPGHTYFLNAGLSDPMLDAGFSGGDAVYLKRGCTWDWHVVITPYVGVGPVPFGNFNGDNGSGPDFLLDAYGEGAPPTLQAEIPAGAWSHLSGNVYSAVVQSVSQGNGWYPSNLSAVKFGALWGNCKGQQVAGYCAGPNGTAALAHNRDWFFGISPTVMGDGCYSNCGVVGRLYVYDDVGSNPTADMGAVFAPLDGSTQLVLIKGVSHVQVQHLRLLNYSWYGLEFSGAGDHYVAANIYADTEVPFNYHGDGFYFNPTAAGDIQALNVESHRGYNGYKFGAGVSAATLTNCKAYFSRGAPLSDLSPGGTAVTYDYCHFYGSGVGSPAEMAPSGGVAGAHNLLGQDPQLVSWQNYTPRFTLNFQKPGASYGDDAALNAQLPALGGAPLSIGIATNYSTSTALIAQFQAWIDAGYDLNSLGLSAVTYSNISALTVQYTGTGSAAALTIAPGSFAITVTGTPADSFSMSVTPSTTLRDLKVALLATGKYAVTWPQPCNSCSWVGGAAMLAQDLAAVSALDVKSAPFTALLDVTQFLSDEAAFSKAWMLAHLTFPGGHQWVYNYPGEMFSPYSMWQQIPPVDIESAIRGAGYAGARGTISMQLGADGLTGAYDGVGTAGVDAQGLITFSLGEWAHLSPSALHAAVREAVAKASVWGVPYVIYWQPGYIENAQLTLVLAELQAAGATLMTNSALVSFLAGKTAMPSAFCSCYAWAPEAPALDFSPTYLSPTVGAGATLSSAYDHDVNGIPQPQTWSGVNASTSATVTKSGWDIGAQALVPIALGGLTPEH